MDNPIIIALIGPAGVGKTTVGKALAQNMAYRFMDLDRAIEAKLGIEIDWIFQLEGEAGFRKYETAVLKDILHQAQDHTVLSTGGGAIVTEENRTLLAKYTRVVYLSATLDTLMMRTNYTKGRPLLAGNPVIRQKKLATLCKQRKHWYASTADFQLPVDHLKIHQAIEAIKTYIGNG